MPPKPATYNANQVAYLPPGTTEIALAQTLKMRAFAHCGNATIERIRPRGICCWPAN
jgi:hypothetical protein